MALKFDPIILQLGCLWFLYDGDILYIRFENPGWGISRGSNPHDAYRTRAKNYQAKRRAE